MPYRFRISIECESVLAKAFADLRRKFSRLYMYCTVPNLHPVLNLLRNHFKTISKGHFPFALVYSILLLQL